MVLKLLFIQWIYIIFTMNSINSYVFFAANLDDFRSIAKKIIPGQLADQLADMASKNPQDSPQEFVNDNINNENNYEESDDYSDDKIKINKDPAVTEETVSQDSYESDLDTYKPLVIKSKLRKRYVIKNQRIDNEKVGNLNIDELVERVKEKLAKEFKISKTDRKEKPSFITTDKVKKIDDYYYKDDNLNVDLTNDNEYEDTEKLGTISQVVTSKDIQQYQDKTSIVAAEYVPENTELLKYDEGNIKDVIEYEEPNLKDVPYENKDVNQGGDYEGTYIKDIPEYYEDKDKALQNKKTIDRGVLNKNSNIKEVAVYSGKHVKNFPAFYKDDTKDVIQVQEESVNVAGENNLDDVKDVPEYYEDDLKEAQPNPNTGDIFKEVDMLQKTNDSYEDYVTPKRDDIFESAEDQTRKPIKAKGIQKFAAANNLKYKLNKPKAIADPVPKKKVIYIPMAPSASVQIVKQPLKRIVKKKQPEEIKGKTESLWYKDPNIDNYDESTKSTTAGNSTKKKGLNTMFPTRAHFKMSSPNYYAKLPAIAEKYNFNEPLPEKDREPENLKHFGNPPAKINKKVKI